MVVLTARERSRSARDCATAQWREFYGHDSAIPHKFRRQRCGRGVDFAGIADRLSIESRTGNVKVVRTIEDPGKLAIAPHSPFLGDSVLRSALAIIAIAALWRLWPAVETTPFHRDEARWIGNSAVLREWRHPLGIGWQDEGYRNVYGTIDESNRRRSQPPLAMYVFGLGLIVQGEGLPTTGYWIMSHDDEWNAAHGHMPSPGELTAARRTNVVIAMLTALGMFAIGMKLTNRIGGLAMGLAYALHPLVLDTSTRAWSDPLVVLCVVAAGVAAIRFGERPTFGRAAVIGVCLGLGAATKLSPLILAVALGGCGLLPLAWGMLSAKGGGPLGTRPDLDPGRGRVDIPGIVSVPLDRSDHAHASIVRVSVVELRPPGTRIASCARHRAWRCDAPIRRATGKAG